jgi:hypothetical protein
LSIQTGDHVCRKADAAPVEFAPHEVQGMIRIRYTAGLVLVALAVAAGGCGKSDGKVPVRGSVSLDGEPLEQGRIELIPSDGKGTTTGAEILDGDFQLRADPGPKTVHITAQKVVGTEKMYPNDPKSPEHDIIEQLIPARYNARTELKCDIKAGENDDLSFSLESDKTGS